MLSEAETTSPTPQVRHDTGVVESTSATAQTYLPSPVNQFLHSVEDPLSNECHTNIADMDQTAAHPRESVAMPRTSGSNTCDECKENQPTVDDTTKEANLADVTCLVELTSLATAPQTPGSTENLSTKNQHIKELQQQLSIAKRVTEEQHSMIRRCCTRPSQCILQRIRCTTTAVCRHHHED